jgi:phage tail tape measure protein, TP901 family, core region
MTSPQQGGVNLGSAYGSITINDNIDAAVSRAIGQFDNALTAIGGKMQALGSSMSNIGAQLTLATAPLMGLGAVGIRSAASFEDAMAEIQARAGLTTEAMEQVSAAALQMGADTAFSAQQSAEGILMLMTAGLSLEDAMATIPAVLTGAAAAGADLGQTAEQVTNIMASFGLAAGEAGRIVEVMNQAAGASPAEMSEMGEALAMVGGSATLLGLSYEQTAASLTVLARVGKVGTEAGTQLNSIFTQMISGTPDNVRAWEMVGSSLFDASGNARDFGVVLAEVKAGMENLSAEDQAFVIQQLAGSYGRVGFNALLASEGLDAVEAQMNEQTSAAEVAAMRMDTFNGRLESLKGSFEALLITAFTPFIEMLTPMLEAVIEVVNAFKDWVSANQRIVQPILKVLSVLLTIGPALIALGTTLKVAGIAMKALGFSFATLTSPLALVIAAIVAFAAAWETNFLGIRDTLQPIIDAVMAQLNVLSVWFTDMGFVRGLQLLFTTFEDGSSVISGFLQIFGMSEETANAIADTLNNVLTPALDVIITVFEAFGQAFTVFRTSLESGWTVFESLDFALQTFFANLGVGMPIISAVRSAIIGIIDTLTGLWAAFQEGGISGAATFLVDNVFTPLINSVQSIDWAQVGSSILSAIGTALSTLTDWATWVYDNILLPIFTNVQTAVASVDWAAVGSSILSAIGTAIVATFNFIGWVYDNLLVPMFNNAQAAIESVDWSQVGANIVNGIGTAIKATFDFIAWIIDSIFGPVTENSETAAAGIDWSAVGATIMNAIKGAIIGIFNFVTWLNETIFTPMINGAASAIATTDWSAVGTNLMTAIGNALPNIGAWVQQHIIGPVQNALSTFNPMALFEDTGNRGLSGSFSGFNASGGNPNIGGSGSFGSGAVPFGSTIHAFARGTNFVNTDMLAMLHKGEAVVPAEFNPAAGGGGISFDGANFTINANSYAEGAAAARGFKEQLEELLRSNG